MMSGKARLPRHLRERVSVAAGYRCGYCRTPQSISGFRLSIEHIIPRARGGRTVEQNLWRACHAWIFNSRFGLRERLRDALVIGSASVRRWGDSQKNLRKS
jgi:hypothetical protein